MEIVEQIVNIQEVLSRKFEEIGISFQSPTFNIDDVICVGIYSNSINSAIIVDQLIKQQIDPVINKIEYNLDWLPEVYFIGVKRADFEKAQKCIKEHAVTLIV